MWFFQKDKAIFFLFEVWIAGEGKKEKKNSLVLFQNRRTYVV